MLVKRSEAAHFPLRKKEKVKIANQLHESKTNIQLLRVCVLTFPFPCAVLLRLVALAQKERCAET